MALADPNDPWSWVFPPEAYGADPLQFGTGGQVPGIFPGLDTPIPPSPGPIGPVGAPIAVPQPPAPPLPVPKPTEPQYPGPKPSQRVGPLGPDVGEEVAYSAPAPFVPDLPSDEPAPEIEMPAEDASPFDQFGQQLGDVARGVVKKQEERQEITDLAGEFERDQFGMLQRLDRIGDKRAELEANEIDRTARLNAEAADRVVQARKEVRAEREAIAVEAKALSDGETWFDKAGTGTKIAGYVAAALAGFLNPTGKNSVVELIQQANASDVAKRQMAIRERSAALGATEQAAEDDYRAEQAAILAGLDRARTEIEKKMNAFDPKGVQAARMLQTYQGLSEAILQAQDRAEKSSLDRKLSQADIDLKQAQAAKYNAEAAKAGRGGSGTGGQASQLTGMVNLPPEAVNWTPTQRNQYLEARKKDLDLSEKYTSQQIGMPARPVTDADGNPVLDADGNPQVESGKPLLNADEKPFRGATPELQKKFNAARDIVDIIDEALAIRERSGGSTSLGNSDDNQRLRVLQEQALIIAKSGTQGMSSDEDMQHLANALGAGDLTSFRARSAGLEKGRERTMKALNTELTTAQYTGKPIKFPNLHKNGPRQQKTDEAVYSDTLKVGGPPLRRYVKHLGDVVLGKVEDATISKEEAFTRLEMAKKVANGSEVKKYAKGILFQARGVPDAQAKSAERDVEYNKIRAAGGLPPVAPPPEKGDPDADFFESTPEDWLAESQAQTDAILAKWEKDGRL